jgi:hypothetical protein
MNILHRLAFVVILLSGILMACQKDSSTTTTPLDPNPRPPGGGPLSGDSTPPPTAPPSAGVAPYSGTWTGMVTVRDSFPNYCTFTDKLMDVRQEWTVLGDSVQVRETLRIDATDWTYYWRGAVKNDTLNMTSKRYVNCFGERRLREMAIRAPVRAVGDSFRVEATIPYSMCPPDCVFVFTYRFSKAR